MSSKLSMSSMVGKFRICTFSLEANEREKEHYMTFISNHSDEDFNNFLAMDNVEKTYSRADAIRTHLETVMELA